jgi:glyoxylase-like metal-dependent hydrolase (beta-lactamase superfamily II)
MSQVKVTIFTAGYCTCPEHLALRGGAWRGIRFPAMFALIEHPRFGLSLYDTGYSFQFFKHTQTWPNRFYRLLTPVTLREEQLAVNQLQARGIRPQDIHRIFISHFHADHISALNDFPQARFVYYPQAYQDLQSLSGLRALSRAFLPGLLPPDFLERSQPLAGQNVPLPPEFAPFTRGLDLFGDQSLFAVHLPGHAPGQAGLICCGQQDLTTFFVSDAAWTGRSIQDNRPPHALANLLFSEPDLYPQTLRQLHQLTQTSPNLRLIPSHCAETLAAYGEAPHA